ncbi:response regulator transcription factor [Yangia mangrovi]|uniref:Response regulator transcription factor n=1 Tax=Alloyangia mangrovi TaxID=1779329 RepID=A0ABT2KFM5_9RHOB|nr:response regulator transcription factor [Alloyangia mangrovi]MCT4369173.1 response regulator transcription factor [Alloyangia mangrovi]
MSDHVLICDDEQDLREMVGEYLGKRGYRTTLAGGADELREKLAQERPDLILLDINMPGEDGLSVLRSLQGPEAPMVIMLTAAGEVIDRVVGLEMGADDYLAKPVDLRELASRIKAVLRRQTSVPEEAPRERTRFRFGKTWLDLDAAKLFDEEGVELPLTAMEFNLLKLFARNRGRVLNRDQILEGAHDRAWDPFDRSIDIRISRIRKKIEVNPAKPEVIRTVRGVGYIYDPG